MALEIINTKYGRGLTSTFDLEEGDLVENSPTLHITKDDLTDKSIIRSYIFNGKQHRGYLLALGNGGLFNHSNEPNISYRVTDDKTIEFLAIKSIKAGEELLIDYCYDPEEHNKNLRLSSDQQNSNHGVEYFTNNLINMKNTQFFSDIKEDLKDAPKEVKESFNNLIQYFSKGGPSPKLEDAIKDIGVKEGNGWDDGLIVFDPSNWNVESIYVVKDADEVEKLSPKLRRDTVMTRIHHGFKGCYPNRSSINKVCILEDTEEEEWFCFFIEDDEIRAVEKDLIDHKVIKAYFLEGEKV